MVGSPSRFHISAPTGDHSQMAALSTNLIPTMKTRRVVTGHDAEGRSIIVSDGDCPVSQAILSPDFVVNDAWRAERLPADNSSTKEPCCAPLELEPSPTGNVFRIVQFPPDRDSFAAADPKSIFDEFGSTGSSSMAGYEGAPHPMMHRTNSVDYIVIISGEIYAIMEKGETLLRQGDVLIQRGTNHAWSNRSDKPCLMAAVLNAATPLNFR